MSVNIAYELTGAGWSQCSLTIDDHTTITTASYLSDALGSLLRAVVNIVRGSVEVRASFAEEPGEYRWVFKRIDENRLNLKILWFDDLWGNKPDDEGRVVFNADCRVRTFAGAVLSASQQVLNEHGREGYRAKWINHDFPEELQDELKRLLARR